MTIHFGVRRAALVLHTLQPSDRAWLLAQFDADEKRLLLGLLEDLNNLGIPADKALLEQAIAPVPTQSRSLESDGGPVGAIDPEMPLDSEERRKRSILDDVQPGTMAQLLKDEPIELVARFMAFHAWSWREATLELLTPLKRSQLQRLAYARTMHAPRLNSALLDLFLACLGPIQLQSSSSNTVISSDRSENAQRWKDKLRSSFRTRWKSSILSRAEQ